MIKFSEKYPEYSFEKNKGYGTKDHREAISNMVYLIFIENLLV